MVSTRRSIDAVEDTNALSLRSRAVEVDFRRSNNSQGSHDQAEYETPRKRRRIGANPDDSADDAKVKSRGEGTALTVLRPKDNADGEPGSSQNSPVVPSSATLAKESAVEINDIGKQLDAASRVSTPGAADVVHSFHKRFQSEDLELNPDKNSDLIILVSEDISVKGQAEAPYTPNYASDDEGAPEIFRANVKQSLSFTPAFKEPKSKKPKSKRSALPDVVPEEPGLTLTSQVGKLGGNGNDQLPFPAAEALSRSKSHRIPDAPSSKRIKDITKDGITYRTLSRQGLRGQTSAWLPAKGSLESRKRKDKLLKRKRVQEVNISHRPKFVLSR
jgi:hypothetical protein